MAENTELKELRAQMTSLRSATSVHTVLEEVAELKRSMAENTELKELRSQIATLNNSVKGKTLKITPDILGLPVKPVCRNCNKNAGGPNDHACYMEIAWSTTYSFPVTRKMLSDENGILRDTDRGGPRELTQKPISILLIPGDKVIVQSATFTCKKQFIHNVVCPFNKTPSWYENDVKNFVQEAFDKLCPEVFQQLETNSSVNINEYMAKYTEWVKEGIQHAAREGGKAGLISNYQTRDFTSPPPKMIATQQNSLNILSESIPQKREFKIINKETNKYLYSDSDTVNALYPSTISHMPPGHSIWTLEPV
jgi:hypothetical protein